MKSPIRNRVGAIFIHVTDMERAIRFYSELLGLPIRDTAHEGNIYDLKMSGGTQVILDSHRKDRPNPSDHPLLFFDTNDIQASYDYVKQKGIEIETDIEIHGDISFFTFKDLDGNVLMINEDKRINELAQMNREIG